MKHRGIKYYGPNDMSSGWHLREAESFFQNWDEHVCNPSINTILELYNIKQYFDSGMRLEQWNDEQLAEFQSKCKLIPGILGRFCSTITDTNLAMLCKEVDWNYTDDFWALTCDYKVYLRISSASMKALMDNEERVVWHVLEHKVLVTSFGQVIAEHLTHNKRTAEELISHFIADNSLEIANHLGEGMRTKS